LDNTGTISTAGTYGDNDLLIGYTGAEVENTGVLAATGNVLAINFVDLVSARVARILANLYRADLRDAGLGTGCHGFRALLPAGLTGRLKIRRASDGAELPWTETAEVLAA